MRLAAASISIIIICSSSLLAQPHKYFASPVDYKINPNEQRTISIQDFRLPGVSQEFPRNDSKSLLDLPREKSGVALLSSALVPGLGQALNGKWGRAGGYFLAEALGIFYHIDQQNKARRGERSYERFANAQWSVVAYSQWIVNYYDQNSLTHPDLETLRGQVGSITPSFNFEVDSRAVDIGVLNSVERGTPFIFADRRGSNFSHILPEYGSQQYYELISKYYQFQGGWRDFYDQNTLNPAHTYQYAWDGSDATNQFFQGVNQAAAFNDNYRAAGNIVTLLIVNHMVSAFDAFFTVKLKNSRRLNTEMNLLSQEQLTVRYSF